MTETKIPFGYHIETERYVDVRDVPSGKECGCKCPGCDLPLIARHCMVGRVDHFAHNTRGQDKRVYEECTFSYWVSVAAMARQIFLESGSFDVAMPDYVYPPPSPWSSYPDHDYVCSKACTITLDKIEVNKNLFGETFDVTGEFKGVPIGIKLVHPEKKGVPDFSDWSVNDRKAVAIAIDISYARSGFQHSKIPLKDVLADSISNDLDCKRWLYHRRMARYLKSLGDKLEDYSRREVSEQFKVQKQDNRQRSFTPSSRNSSDRELYKNDRGEYLFYCRRCDHEIFLNARECLCDLCSGAMSRIHRYQVNPRNFSKSPGTGGI